MAQYTHTTYLQFRQLVANRLSDPNNIFWTDTEIKRYCLEALRTWNAMSWYSRDFGTFDASQNVAFYDLPSNLLGSSAVPQVLLLSYNLKDQDLYTDIKYALLEDASTTNSWTGSDQFDQQSIQDALQETRNQFLFETGIVATHSTLNASNMDGVVGLPDNIQHLNRVAYQAIQPTNLPFVPLQQTDEYSATSYNTDWQTTATTPISYSTVMQPKLNLHLIPIPALMGTLDLLTINAPTDLNLSVGALLNIPDDLAWVIKYGTLYTLLSGEGQRNDPLRAQYCLERYQQGIQLAKLWNTIQQPYINGVPLVPTTIASMDSYRPLWQTATGTSKPTDIIVCSPNLIALSPIPDGNGPYSVSMDSLRNFPIPIQDTDFIQVGREELISITNYVAHLASFKQGSKEFTDTIPLAQEMMDEASYYNSTLRALSPNLFTISNQSIKQTKDTPISKEAVA